MSELVILKQPEESSRFRYSGKSITHGCIYAKGSTKHLKKHPTVEVRNFFSSKSMLTCIHRYTNQC